jgi:hypothetical protein
MLVQYTSIGTLDAAAISRLIQASSGLLQTSEAAQGYVIFEGKYYSVQDVRSLTPRPPLQVLTEG